MYKQVVDIVRAVGRGNLQVAGPEDGWEKLVLEGQAGTLTLSPMVRQVPDDEFSRLVMGMYGFFQSAETDQVEVKQAVLDTVSEAEMFIGVVAEPTFCEEDGHSACVLAIVAAVEGMLFDGETMIGGDGNRIL